jgi:hypothetical protein
MTTERCPKCGRLLSQESRDPCQCKDRPSRPKTRGLDGKFFVRVILGIAALVALLSIGLYHAIAYLRTLHGLSGLPR